MRRASIFCLILLLGLFLAPLTFAQTTTGTLVGQVFEEASGTRIPLSDALIQVINQTNGNARTTRSSTAGDYRLAFLEPGIYTIRGTREGFLQDVIVDFPIALNKVTLVIPPPLVLKRLPPTPAPTPTPTPAQSISAQDPREKSKFVSLVNSADAALRGNFPADQIAALPLPGVRSVDVLALLVSGVAVPPPTYGVAGPGVGPGVGTSGQFSVAGLRSRANNFTIDGSDNNDQDIGVRRQGFTALISQSAESVQEFQLTTILADAEAGRNFGAQVNLVSKTGGNQFHGSIYDLLTNDRLNARNFFDLPGQGQASRRSGKPSFTRNQFGATFGGPLKADRAHFFFSIERQDINRTEQVHFSVPTAQERPNRFLIVSQDIFGLYPLPNNPGGPYGINTLTRELNASGEGTLFSIKIDGNFELFNRRQELSGRYNFTDDESIIPAVGGAVNASLGTNVRTQNLSLILTTPINSRIDSLLRFSYGRTRLGFDEQSGSPFIFSSNPTNRINADLNGDGRADLTSGATGPVGQLTIVPFSSIGVDVFTFPQGRTNNTFQIAESVNVSAGRHSLKFGADIRRTQLNSFLDRNFRPQVAFTGGFVFEVGRGLSLGRGVDLVNLGVATNIFQTLATSPDSTIGLRFTEAGLFVQDSWRATSRLVISAGLRYDINTVPAEVNNRIERTFTLDNFPTPASELNQPSFVAPFNNAVAALRGILDGRSKIYLGDENNFAPRVSFALDLLGTGRLVLRGGYGLYYDQILGSVVSNSRNVFPTFIPVNFDPTFLPVVGNQKPLVSNPAFFSFNQVFPIVQPGTTNVLGLPPAAFVPGVGVLFSLQRAGGLAFTLPDKNLRTPYAHQYTFTLESQLARDYVVSVSYVGSAAHKLARFRQPNFGPAAFPLVAVASSGNSLQINVQQRIARPDARLGAYTIFENSANSNYHALQLSLAKRYSNGFDLLASYTYAHAIDEVSDVFDLAGAFAFPQNERNLRAERGSANFDARQRFTLASSFLLPFARDNKLLGGWQISGVLALQTGLPFTVNSAFDVNGDGTLTDRLNTTAGLVVRDNGLVPLALAPGTNPLSLLAPLGTTGGVSNGAVGRNTFRAGGFANVDTALSKEFFRGERASVQFRLEAFNLFNRANFAIPVRVLEAPAFGRAVSTVSPARIIQFQAKLLF
ncbi:MAG: TonB-dependent receptor [Acidobacteriota bacterium]